MVGDGGLYENEYNIRYRGERQVIIRGICYLFGKRK